MPVPVDEDMLRRTMRLWTSGVTIVTAANQDHRAGMTVSSFTSVSLQPPLILVCLEKDIVTLQLARESGAFGVSLLRADQAALSGQFAGHIRVPEGQDRFYGVDFTTAVTGAPLLEKAIAWLDCRVYAIYDGGTSDIMLGEVLATWRDENSDPAPLAYYNQGYRGVTSTP